MRLGGCKPIMTHGSVRQPWRTLQGQCTVSNSDGDVSRRHTNLLPELICQLDETDITGELVTVRSGRD